MDNSYADPPSNTERLYPALIQCFAIIFCGYISGILGLVSQTQAKGLGTYVGTFALPSLIFLSLAKLDFSVVNWNFLLSILVAKGIIFIGVIIVTLLITKPSHLGRAGLFAIFCTQSNDFALGYPIIDAVYNATHKEYATYLYLMAPISLVVLNPIAYILMEINKQSEVTQALTESQRKAVCKLKLMGQIVKGIAYNPISIMTVLGILANVMFKQGLSTTVEGLFDIFGKSFTGTALFLLGFRMVGQIQRLYGAALLLPGVLIIVKLLVLPLVMRETVSLLQAGDNDTDTLSLSTYAFLYGTIPTAPAVFIISGLYQLEMELIASSMVLCTLISAPIMLMSAQLINIPTNFIEHLQRFTYNLSIASLVAIIWLFGVFIYTKKYKIMPHRITMCLIISQAIQAIGVICGGPTTDPITPAWLGILQRCITVFGMYSAALWTAMLALGLLLFESRSSQFLKSVFPLLVLMSWGASCVLLIALVVAAKHGQLSSKAFNAIRLGVLLFSLTLTTACLILYLRIRRRSEQISSISADLAGSINETTTLVDNVEPVSTTQSLSANGTGCYGTITETPSPVRSPNGCCSNDPNCENVASTSVTRDIEDIGDGNGECECPDSLSPCPCLEQLETPAPQEGRGGQILRHTVLLVLYTAGMFVSAAYTAWSLLSRDESSVYAQLGYVDAACCAGAGLLAAALLAPLPAASTPRLLLARWIQAWRTWFGSKTVVLPDVEDLPFETKTVCDQFITHHLDRCKEAIAKDTRLRMRTYRAAFRGSCLSRWLRSAGLAGDEAEAVLYGRHLLDGRVIRHVHNLYHFIDGPMLYCFN